ncbi:MAG: nuclear transport factor 2 family protein, partial [Acidimicrobiia bacterium]
MHGKPPICSGSMVIRSKRTLRRLPIGSITVHRVQVPQRPPSVTGHSAFGSHQTCVSTLGRHGLARLCERCHRGRLTTPLPAWGGERTTRGLTMNNDDLIAREAIRHTLASYHIAGDGNDADGYAAVFTEDGVVRA